MVWARLSATSRVWSCTMYFKCITYVIIIFLYLHTVHTNCVNILNRDIIKNRMVKKQSPINTNFNSLLIDRRSKVGEVTTDFKTNKILEVTANFSITHNQFILVSLKKCTLHWIFTKMILNFWVSSSLHDQIGFDQISARSELRKIECNSYDVFQKTMSLFTINIILYQVMLMKCWM